MDRSSQAIQLHEFGLTATPGSDDDNCGGSRSEGHCGNLGFVFFFAELFPCQSRQMVAVDARQLEAPRQTMLQGTGLKPKRTQQANAAGDRA